MSSETDSIDSAKPAAPVARRIKRFGLKLDQGLTRLERWTSAIETLIDRLSSISGKILRLAAVIGVIVSSILFVKWYFTSHDAQMPAVHREAVERALGGLIAKENVDMVISAIERTRNVKVIEAANAGNLVPAEKAVSAQAAKIERQPSADDKTKAQAFADLAVVTYRDNVAEKIKWLTKATELAPSEPEHWRQLGIAASTAGEATKAIAAFEKLGEIAQLQGNDRLKFASRLHLGDMVLYRLRLEDAMEHFAFARLIATAGASNDANDRQWQIDLAAAHVRIGQVLSGQGNSRGALEAFRKSLAIRQSLVEATPGDAERQREYTTILNHVGDMVRVHGDRDEALALYHRGLAIRERLNKDDPDNTLWQRGMSVSYEKIGHVLRQLGKPAEAAEFQQRSYAIADTLASGDASNLLLQSNLSASLGRQGAARLRAKDIAGALENHRKSLTIRQQLVVKDPANMMWQRNLSSSFMAIGDALRDGSALDGALDEYAKAITIRRMLVAKDPANSDWQLSLHFALNRVASTRHQMGDKSNLIETYNDSLRLYSAMAARDPANVEHARDMMFAHWQIADAGERPSFNYGKARDIVVRLRDSGKLEVPDRHLPDRLTKLAADAENVNKSEAARPAP
ncbi:MAG: tetratricopeptide repeat protein [Bosea sp. (in: a-proteobacteria)]